jgi:selenocysteine lyase/cysteine desulfurase
MTSRKKFLSGTAISAAALFLPKWSFSSSTQLKNPSLADIDSLFLIDKNITFLNSATMGISPKPVVEALTEGLMDVTQRCLYGRRRQEAIDSIASFVGASREEIALTHNCTEAINLMVWGVPLQAGDEVIISQQEHVGNAAAWLHRANLQKIVVKTVAAGNTAAESLQFIQKACTKKTKIIAVPHVLCTNGQVMPIADICAFARKKNILTCIDGAHGTGMIPLQLEKLGVDFYASCCHKWLLAAQGTGYLYINKQKLNTLQAMFYGAEGTTHFYTMQKNGIGKLDEKIDSAQRFTYGTQSGALLNSVTAAIQFQNGIGTKNIYSTIKELNNYTLEGLKQFKKQINILTPVEESSRAGVLSFKFINKDNKAFYDKEYAKGTILRYVAENDINSIRVSTHIFNTKQEIDSLLIDIEIFLA